MSNPPNTDAAPAADDIWSRTQLLVEVLLCVMEQELQQDGADRSERWIKLFGSKDSAVANLQKLVQLLAALQAHAPRKTGAKVQPVDAAELGILNDWLGAANAANVWPVAE